MKWTEIQTNPPIVGIRPIQVFFEQGISDAEKNAVRNGINKVLKSSGIYTNGILDSLGLYPSDLINVNLGVEGRSKIQRCLEQGRKASKISPQLDAAIILSELIPENCKDYQLLITHEPLYSFYPEEGLVHIYGATSKPASVVSISDFSKLTIQQKCFGLESLVIHELGRSIGNLPNSKEKDSKGKPKDTISSYGLHCTSPKCLMNQGYSPKDFVEMGIYAQTNSIFCVDCATALGNTLRGFSSAKGNPICYRVN